MGPPPRESVVVVVLNVASCAWASNDGALAGPAPSLEATLTALCAFLSAVSAGWGPGTRISVIGAHATDAALVWESRRGDGISVAALSAVLARFVATEEGVAADRRDAFSLPLALSSGLAVLHARGCGEGGRRGRVLWVEPGRGASYAEQFNELLALAFAARALAAPVDVCVVGPSPPAVCGDVARVAGGAHLCFADFVAQGLREDAAQRGPIAKRLPQRVLDDEKAVGQLLNNFFMFYLAAPPETRNALPGVASHRVSAEAGGGAAAAAADDGGAVCWCHRRHATLCRVCSACLVVYCTDFRGSACAMCGAEFENPGDAIGPDATVATACSALAARRGGGP